MIAQNKGLIILTSITSLGILALVPKPKPISIALSVIAGFGLVMVQNQAGIDRLEAPQRDESASFYDWRLLFSPTQNLILAFQGLSIPLLFCRIMDSIYPRHYT